eukprot:gene4005-5039_t
MSVEVAQTTLNELLILDKLDRQLLTLEYQDVKMMDFLRNTIQPFYTQATAKDITMQFIFDGRRLQNGGDANVDESEGILQSELANNCRRVQTPENDEKEDSVSRLMKLGGTTEETKRSGETSNSELKIYTKGSGHLGRSISNDDNGPLDITRPLPIGLDPTDGSVEGVICRPHLQRIDQNEGIQTSLNQRVGQEPSRRRSSKEDTMLHADPNKLAQVIRNLVSNALKFTPTGGTVTIRAYITPKDIHPHMYNNIDNGDIRAPSRSVWNGMVERFRGVAPTDGVGARPLTGVGDLTVQICDTGPVSKRFMELHGGDLTVHSDGPGRGSTFSFVIPLLGVPPARHRSSSISSISHTRSPSIVVLNRQQLMLQRQERGSVVARVRSSLATVVDNLGRLFFDYPIEHSVHENTPVEESRPPGTMDGPTPTGDSGTAKQRQSRLGSLSTVPENVRNSVRRSTPFSYNAHVGEEDMAAIMVEATGRAAITVKVALVR